MYRNEGFFSFVGMSSRIGGIIGKGVVLPGHPEAMSWASSMPYVQVFLLMTENFKSQTYVKAKVKFMYLIKS